MENKSKNNSEDEINLLALFKTVIRGRKTIVRFIIIFGIIGLFIALFSEKEYIASTTVVPQVSTAKIGGNLGGLAAIAGINIGGSGSKENIPPSLYPEIVKSIPFQKELLKIPLSFSDVKKEITYKEYYEKYKKSGVLSIIKSYTIGLPNKIFSLFKKKSVSIPELETDSIYRVSMEENTLFKQLQGQLTLDINSKDGFIKISFSMPEALPSAQMTKEVRRLLQKAIINFKTQKTKDEFSFIKGRYIELKEDFEKKQSTLARFIDRNQGLVTSRSQSRLEILKSECSLARNIYSELAKQLETQKIKLKENTPIFTVIEPVSVPVVKSKPKRLMILIIWLFLGGILSVGFVLSSKWVGGFKVSS